MNVSHYYLPRFLARWAESVRQRHRRRIGERVMSELPPELQRDIGWDPSTRSRR